MPTPLEKFQSLLRELFQFEQADLDFGVYRIMNLRRARMEKWLNEELPARARAILQQGGSTADDDLGGRLEVLKSALLELEPGGVDEDGNITKDFLKQSTKGKEYLKLKAQADRAPARTAAGMEPLVYNHLYDFFSRYYDTGDFIPKRRRSFAPDGRDTYAIPWDGEEVVLHWANKDQYYIKTGERFTHYRWQSEAGGRTVTVEFRLTDADLPANNNKDAKKKFNLLVSDKVEWQEDKATLILPFHYRGLTPEEEGQYTGTQEAKLRESIIKRTVDALREMPAILGVSHLATALMAPKRDAAGQEKRDKDGNAVPLLPHHLNRWAVKNESDFFIHKNLRRFLSGELDYFLKSVVLNLDNLLAAGAQRAEPNFRLLEAVKRLGTEIVDFVGQLEDFQKALFEKKKFVLETSWCLTLDRIPVSAKEEVYAAILANDRQWAEWEILYKISKWPADFATVTPRTREFLEAYPYMSLNTGMGYPQPVADTLIGALENLEQRVDGVLVHSDNFQALSLLARSTNNSIDAVYIDPPYNTHKGDFNYKDSYPSSSWAASILQTTAIMRGMLRPEGVAVSSIADQENHRLRLIWDGIFGPANFLANFVWNNEGNIDNQSKVKSNHEYLIGYCRNLDAFPHPQVIAPDIEQGSKLFNDTIENSITKNGPANPPSEVTLPIGFPAAFESGRVDAREDEWPHLRDDIVVEDGKITAAARAYSGWSSRALLDEFIESDCAPILDSKGLRTWFKVTHTGAIYVYKARENQSHVLSVIRNVGTVKKTAGFLKHMGFEFDYPKPIPLVEYVAQFSNNNAGTICDYYGGSGTTAHAVINLNRRRTTETRRYLVVEMGAYFDSILFPRVRKAVFSEDWNETVPVRQINTANSNNPYNGISHCIKVLRLESYEDALDNIEFNSGAAPGAELGLDFRRDYELRYALDWESKDCPTRLAVAQLDTPFDYTLTLRRESGTVLVKPDLPETFAYLIGLHTRRRFREQRDGVSYLIYTGKLHGDGTEVAVLWRTCKDWTEANLKAEMDWWCEQCETLAPGATRVYVNGASAIEGHHSLDAEFKTRMHGGTV